jgi:ribosomal protein S18 acetylase RimI-like enzyme
MLSFCSSKRYRFFCYCSTFIYFCIFVRYLCFRVFAMDCYNLKTAAPEDMGFLYRVYAATREEELTASGWDSTQKEQFLRFQFRIQDVQYRQNYPRASFYIICIGVEPCGRLYLNRGPTEYRIVDISLLPVCRNRGTGTQILRDVIAEADAAALPVRLSVVMDNPARRLYERLGFTITGDNGVYLSMERPALVRIKN